MNVPRRIRETGRMVDHMHCDCGGPSYRRSPRQSKMNNRPPPSP
jgi:hypothetical protein